MTMENNYKKFFKDYSTIYQKVKEIIVFSENYNSENKVYISILNELRNSLDHLVKIFAGVESPEKELERATQHILRAGYDSWEILSISLIKDITDSLNRYESLTISQAFPDYYTKVKPTLVEIKKQLSDIRKSKKIPESDFHEYSEKINKLFDIKQLVDKSIPVLEEYRKKKKDNQKRKKIFNLVIGIVIGIIVSIISSLLINWLGN